MSTAATSLVYWQSMNGAAATAATATTVDVDADVDFDVEVGSGSGSGHVAVANPHPMVTAAAAPAGVNGSNDWLYNAAAAATTTTTQCQRPSPSFAPRRSNWSNGSSRFNDFDSCDTAHYQLQLHQEQLQQQQQQQKQQLPHYLAQIGCQHTVKRSFAIINPSSKFRATIGGQQSSDQSDHNFQEQQQHQPTQCGFLFNSIP
ncbi:uncharacterized protein LOC116805547 [Drosophila grimshawi]|uniref:uncharacterized protein LOC116805547 n=1 Tax=Drosophila grimshawi TaxID=7222 RepID=UPI000C870C18|nr:uncharacterized protein LOC116805547 [Drosophila grimshawi]